MLNFKLFCATQKMEQSQKHTHESVFDEGVTNTFQTLFLNNTPLIHGRNFSLIL